MFNGYHEPSATSYNDLELDRGKKNQGATKWACGNGTSIQSTHLHPQNQQSEIWMSKPPFIGLPNAASPKCNCPSCFQLPESQSYQGEIPWHRSWFSRTYPVATHDLVKIPGNWENAGLPGESYPEQVGGQFVHESGDKPLFYKPYSGLRHEIYQPGVISTVKKVARKDLKQDEVVGNVGHHARYAASVSNPGYDSFRTAIDQRLIEERTNYCNQNEKFINADSCRQQGGLPYGLNPNRRTILESYSKTVPSNANQNRVPSVGHRTIKDNDFHSCIDQNDMEKTGPYINHGGTDDKHYKTHSDVNPGQENLHAGLMNAFSSATDYLNRELPNPSEKDFHERFMNGRTPQYFPRNNISDVMNRNPNTVLNYNANRKGVINVPTGSTRAAQTPPKHAEIVSKSPNFGKDCIVLEKMSPGQKIMMNNNVKIPPDRFHKAGEEMLINRPVIDANPPEKSYMSSPQNTMYKGYRRPQEYPYGRRNVQRPYDNPNGLINLRNDIPVGMSQGVPNFPDLRKGLDAYPRVNNPFPNDGSPHQFHYQHSGDSKPQSSFGPQFPPKAENLRETEKENPGRISHLEAIPYEEICKSGTSKISPLRLLRKKKVIHQKEDVAGTSTPDAVTTAKSASPPLDVRRFWATWAEEEDDNVPQTQMVVLDCHNIDPEQAGLLHLYNPDNIRTVNLEDGNVLDMKGTHFEKGSDQSAAINGKASIYEEKLPESERLEAVNVNDVKVPGKVPEFSLGVPLILDPVKEAAPDVETKTNVIVQPNHFGRVMQNQPSDVVKQFDGFKNETKSDESNKDRHADIENPVFTKVESVPVADEKTSATEEGCADFVGKEESVSSYSSDDSQTGELPVLPDLPTSEYRKNKFLDYSDDSFCNGGVLEGVNKETVYRKQTEESDCQVEDKLKDFLTSKPTEIGPGSFEIDDILKKLSDINFQGVGAGSPALADSPDKHKTDKKILESRKEKKTKKQSHKSSRTDQVTLQNISLSKPTIKFSIQKSHDLKISFKVLNNKKKHEEEEEEDDDDDDDAPSDEDNQEDRSPDCFEDGEITDRLKKNKRRLITLKLKGVSEGNDEEDADSGRKSKKGLKKKKVRWEKSPSPKTPVLKIKKSRYMMMYGCESEEFREACNGAADDASKSSEGESTADGDFQVHETVDSAKIKLTFKRNKNGGDRKEKCCDDDDVTDELTDSCLKSITDSPENPNDCEHTTPYEYFKEEKEDRNEDSIDSTVKGDEDMNNDVIGESGCSETHVPTVESPNADEDMMDDFKKEDIIVEPLDIVNSSDDAPIPEESNSPKSDNPDITPVTEPAAMDTDKDIPEPCVDTQSLEVDALRGETDKNAEDVQEDEDISNPSKVDDVTDNKEVEDDKPNCAMREPLIDSLEMLLESKSEESAVKAEEGGEKSPIPISHTENDEKVDEPGENGENRENEDITPEDVEEGELQSPVCTQDDDKLENTEATEQRDCEDVDIKESPDRTETQNDADEPPTIPDLPCDLELDEGMTEIELEPAETQHSPEQPTADVDTHSVENDDGVSENVAVEDDNKDEMEVETCEQKPEPEQPETKETVAEDNQTKLENIGCPNGEPDIEDAVEEKNNNDVGLHREKTVFVGRKILRRCSCEEMIREQETNKKRVTSRSMSLNIELTIVESAEPEIAVLDVAVSEIPLPPGDAPPENCLNLEEYFKSKMLEIEAKADVGDVKAVTSPEILEDTSKPVVQDVSEPSELVPGESVPCVDESVVNEEEKQVPRDESVTEKEAEGGSAVQEPLNAEEIRIEDLEVFGTRDADITLEESSFRVYECDGLAFDEALTITDDMEEEKVSDDDKFRNIMQNCLDNAKKFLSVGLVDDLLEGDVDAKKSDSHVSKDVLLTSCEESDDLILPNSRHQSMDLSLDFVPSFCPDIGTNPCSEILPVDNWPYLEEEVASSPLRNKTEESDLLCCLNDISSTENYPREGKFSMGRLKRQRRASLHADSKRNGRSIAERRRTIEGIGRWKTFRSTDEELSDAENIQISTERRSKQPQNHDRKQNRTKPYSDGEGKTTVKRPAYYMSSLWQPRVVLFRISKNNSPDKSNTEVDVSKRGGGSIDRDKTQKEREHPSRPDGIKRKKTRFRNLHTKKRIVPDSSDQTKENKSTFNLVDSESDSSESSPSSDPPREIIHSHSKSTKTAEDFPSRKSKSDATRTQKHDKGREKRKRDAHEVDSQSKRRKDDSLRREKRCWVCEVCGFSKTSERATHIQSHPFHCQSCHLAFKTEANFVEHLTRKHKDIRNQHHCLLCELSFDLEKEYYRHLETREHKHLESVEKNTINTLFRLLTGQPCPVLGPVESKPEWLPSQAGTVHFYHQATPLSLALQYLKLHHDKKKLSTEASE